MKPSTKKLLLGFKDILNNKPLSKRYLKNEEKILIKRKAESDRLQKQTEISYEKLHEKFTI
jgi:hypothetical protein